MSKSLNNALKKEILLGWFIVAFGVVGLGLWVFKSEISQAALATGSLEPSGGSLMVQHKRGGVVASVHVREGESVQKGDALVTLISDDLDAELARLDNRLIQARAKQHRLMLEFGGKIGVSPLI